jgi:hypothetical protein
MALALAACAAAQAAPYRAPRTAYGQPDLQGFWTGASLTQLQRPPGEPLTFASAAEEQRFMARRVSAWKNAEEAGLGQGVSEWHEQYGLARIGGRLRTSWIVSPADGRLPWRPEVAQRIQAKGDEQNSDRADNPESRSAAERCLVGAQGTADPPMLNATVGNGKQIVQTKDEVVILSEMNHDVRIIRLGQAHLPAALTPWLGDSVGRWEGETLVVETVGFHPEEGHRGQGSFLSPQARVTERFTRVAGNQILYAFEVDDPATYTAAWRGEMPLNADTGPIFEYACHEGERDVEEFMSAARRREAVGKGSAAAASR